MIARALAARALAVMALVAMALAGMSLATPASAQQVSARLALGGGGELARDADVGALFEVALRAEVLFGAASTEQVRIGPALDLRAANFRTAEVAGGAMVFVPTGRELGLALTLGAGYALRDRYRDDDDRDGPLGLATLALAYRPFDHDGVYAEALALYASGRAAFEGWQSWELTLGVEIDLELVVWSPIAFLLTARSARDPDEPDDATR